MSTFDNFHPSIVKVTLKKNPSGYFIDINLNILNNSDAQAFYISFFKYDNNLAKYVRNEKLFGNNKWALRLLMREEVFERYATNFNKEK
jgi:hypothetical protein